MYLFISHLYQILKVYSYLYYLHIFYTVILAALVEKSWIRTRIVMHPCVCIFGCIWALIPSGLSSPAEAALVLWYHVWWRSPCTRTDRASPARRPLHPHPTYSLLTQHTRVLHSCTRSEVKGQRSGHTWHVEGGARLLVFVVFVFLEFGHEAEFSAATALGEIRQLTLHTNTH